MSCRENVPGAGRKNSPPEKASGRNGWQRLGVGIGIGLGVGLWMLFTFLFMSSLQMRDRVPDPRKDAHVWEQMRGNDGKFWKGTPGDSSFDKMDEMEGREYYHYYYDAWGRLSHVDYFRHHDYYEDVWCLSDEIRYEYDLQGRMIRELRNGREEFVYQYTDDGYSKTRVYNEKTDTYDYDAQENLIFSHIAIRYAPGYETETVYVYDDKNRKVQETTKVGSDAAYVSMIMTYDEEAHTGLMKTYDWAGDLVCIGLSVYDEEWREVENSWCDVQKLPKAVSVEDWMAYRTEGWWADYKDGHLMERLENRWGGTNWNSGWYEVYDYDENGNCILCISVLADDYINVDRYEYDDGGRMTDEYGYRYVGDKLELDLSDGTALTLEHDEAEEGALCITRRMADGSLFNRFVFGEKQVMQYTPEKTVCWYTVPRNFLVADSGDDQAEGDDQSDRDPQDIEDRTDQYFYIVQPGDSLWSIGERYLGDGRMWTRIYAENREVVGDDPWLILPGMRLYLDQKQE